MIREDRTFFKRKKGLKWGAVTLGIMTRRIMTVGIIKLRITLYT
jgi:hypothetical protein